MSGKERTERKEKSGVLRRKLQSALFPSILQPAIAGASALAAGLASSMRQLDGYVSRPINLDPISPGSCTAERRRLQSTLLGHKKATTPAPPSIG